MALRLKIAGALGRSLGDRGAMEFGPSGGTIGRSPECSWVLPDTHRYLSSRHASIDFRGGCYYIVDTSTNGVYVNDAEQPVGRGKPQRLFNGDRIRMGEYEMAVEIDDDTIERLIDQHHVEPVPLAQRVEAPSEPTSELVDAYEMTGVGIEMMLTDDELHTLTPPKKRRSAPVPVLELEDDAPDTTRASIEHGAAPPRPQAPQAARPGAAVRAASAAQQRPLATPPTDRSKPNGSSPPPKPNGAAPRTGAAPAKAPAPARASAPPSANRAAPNAGQHPASPAAPSAPAAANARAAGPAQPTPGAATPRAPAAPAPKPTAGPAAAATTAPRGAAPLDAFFRGAGIDPRRIGPHDADALLHRIGQLMREMIVGVSAGLAVCAQQRSSIGVPAADEDARSKNPLLSDAGVDEKLLKLLLAQSSTPQRAVGAVRAAFGDVRLHQQILMKALRGALDAYVARLDPDELEQKYGGGRYTRLLGAANKLKYWDLYKDVYDVVAHHPPGELPITFVEELAAAYEREVEAAANGAPTPEPSIHVEAL